MFHDLRYAHNDKAYAIAFFERSLVAQQTFHHICERRFTSQIPSRVVSDFAQFDCLSWRNGLAVNMKCVKHEQWLGSLLHAILIL